MLAEDVGGIHPDHVGPDGGEGGGLADGAADPVGEGRVGVGGGEVDRERETAVVQGVGQVAEVGGGSEAGRTRTPGARSAAGSASAAAGSATGVICRCVRPRSRRAGILAARPRRSSA
ncbi:hypothetical protein BC477_03970 [Clavibacter michiganensis subsp. michiganensis]|uniref:Uncharacterized protein n=1 Tax=Clavibacter michiganensis subsp. michiganensis TaxID=33013 RepID=A0A251XLE3_CLAMM|nr:hypothetical protein BC477_03970 [Clavibacter michiganensis subsp. michiganensis]OUE03868.1 hypothetical protein CMMCAS07_02905 [Clavibacter michiganensis subsp. michiganensis]